MNLHILESDGDIFNANCPIVIPVNCVGVMGKGLAKEAVKRYGKEAFKQYFDICKHPIIGEEFSPGDIVNINLPHRTCYLVATKNHWIDPYRIHWVTRAVESIIANMMHWSSQSRVAIPALGCGCGGLDWREVRKEIITTIASTLWANKYNDAITVTLYNPK